MRKIICVAEKPSAAKAIAGILSNNSFRTTSTDDRYVKNYEFDYNLDNRPAKVIMTSVRGHLSEFAFVGKANKEWFSCDPGALFNYPINQHVPEDYSGIEKNLKTLARSASVVYIWTDCDREGEAIGGEVADVCLSVNSRLEIWRARFSAMQPAAIQRAAQSPSRLDQRQVDAVNVRSELDLRVGAAFTRIQTIRLRPMVGDRKCIVLILFQGGCQFPTLGFVVDRYLDIQEFVAEDFWKIHMQHTKNDNGQEQTTQFNWKRNRLFDRHAAYAIYERCVNNPVAVVVRLDSKSVSKRKPLPLTTVEMQKTLCKILRMSGEHIMKIAEELYTSGHISYPRTETDQYDSTFEFRPIIEQHTEDSQWGQYARLLMGQAFERPRNGSNNDKAHPPIHPTGYTHTLSGDHKKVYEFIVRRFLGCCWRDAQGNETNMTVSIEAEEFEAKGLMILERNYLDVYTYDKWSGNQLARYSLHERFTPTALELKSGRTEAPNLLTEYDLISLMEKHEIGTDATIAEHIQKILDRGYAFKVNQYFRPSSLGISLVLGYDAIGFESSLSKPHLRRQMEADLKSICEGRKGKEEVLQASLERYKDMFIKLLREFSTMTHSINVNYDPNETPPPGSEVQRSRAFERPASEPSVRTRGRGRGRGRANNPARGPRGRRGRNGQ
ncbi:DNA topoisomerase [Phycomyces nitens]|nr:DNA topoisomerase [Phycomyces nitens]